MKNIFLLFLVLCGLCYGQYTPQPKSDLGIRQMTEVLPTPIFIEQGVHDVALKHPGVYALTGPLVGVISLESDNITLLVNGHNIFGQILMLGSRCAVDFQGGSVSTNTAAPAIFIGNGSEALSHLTIKNGSVYCYDTGSIGISVVDSNSDDVRCLYGNIKILNMNFSIDQLSPAAIAISRANDMQVFSCTVHIDFAARSPQEVFSKIFNYELCSGVKVENCVISGPGACVAGQEFNCASFGMSFNYCNSVLVDRCQIECLGAQTCATAVCCKDSTDGVFTSNLVQNCLLAPTTDSCSSKFFLEGMHFLNCSGISAQNNRLSGIRTSVSAMHWSGVSQLQFHVAGIGLLDSKNMIVQENELNEVSLQGLKNIYDPLSDVSGIVVSTLHTEEFDTNSIIQGNVVNAVNNAPDDQIDSLKNIVSGISIAKKHVARCTVTGNRVCNTHYYTIVIEPQGTCFGYFCEQGESAIESLRHNLFVNNVAIGTRAKYSDDYSAATAAFAQCRLNAPFMINVKTLDCPS